MRIFRQAFKKGQVAATTKKWYADIHLSSGKRYAMPLYESEKLSREFANPLEALVNQSGSGLSLDKNVQQWLSQLAPDMLARLIKLGLVDANRAEGARPIKAHVSGYIEYLGHKGNTKNYCKLCSARIQSIIDGCKFRILVDIQSGKIQKWVSDELAAGRISQGTHNHYLRAIKGFLRWLYREDRLEKDVSKHLMLCTVTEIAKDRRALTVDEIGYLLDWTATKGKKTRSLTGWERSLLYRLALTTGLRVNEIRHLHASSIDFEAKTVRLPSAYTKNRKEAALPLRDDVLKDLRTLTSGKTPNSPLFRHITDKSAKLLKADMKGARAGWVKEGKTSAEKKLREKDDLLKVDTADGEIDFHALRHSYATMLVNGGTDVKTAQSLLRHSTPLLTLGIYSHVLRESEQTAVDNLPSFEKQQKPKTKKKA